MAYKRKKKSAPKSSGQSNGKRPKFFSDDSKSGYDASRGYVDPSTGQRGAFPGLDNDDGGDFYGPANDGLDYLRMVRSEAKSVPSLLIAGQVVRKPKPKPKSKSESEIDGLNYDDDNPDDESLSSSSSEESSKEGEEKEKDTRGWYSDGTYTASAICTFPQALPTTTALDIWHDSLLMRFRHIRINLHITSSVRPAAENTFHPPSSNLRPWDSSLAWQKIVMSVLPTPRILWGLDQQTVLKLLEWNTRWLSRKTILGIGKCRSGWLWGLLVRLDECLAADEISVVRELGKKCVRLRKTLLQERAASREDIDEEEWHEAEEESEPMHEQTANTDPNEIGLELEEGEVEEQEIEQALPVDPKTHLEAITKSESASEDIAEAQQQDSKENTLITFDMVISIVGDFFGQKDLLVERNGC